MKNLANELRPEKISEIIGQRHIKHLLSKVIENKLTSSFIFFGESGIGKSSTAFALAKEMNLKYAYFNASIDNKKDLIDLLENNEILIVDEIHRLNKDKQDILLSYLEFDKIIIYATTTENPYFKVNPAVRSRMQILQFYKLSEDDMFNGLKINLVKFYPNLKLSDSLIKRIVKLNNGDYRSCLNHLQILALIVKDKEVTIEDIKNVMPNMNFYSDENSVSHYNNLSAFHKSLRGSDINAAFYYGELIIKTGDFQGLFRRLLACAYEDIGLADTTIGTKVKDAIDAFEILGMPEGRLPLFNAIAFVALSPKSNSIYEAINKVEDFIDEGNVFMIPKHLQEGYYANAYKLGEGVGYKYPHDFENHFVKQEYLPKEAKNINFFKPKQFDSKKIVEYYKTVEEWKE
ncbi:recombination factor protein RarA [Mycoplasmopsis maculosa]|uniref:Recombination factor protein RarA n=1 Tax=Mycoplasmopsis maculosa TaxID=114885 RepID=A0A449B4G2_9BACT|nr:AAA family ATPase [Mycoplasmopsis maculosa]VEU75459.1 recombination factor protein RarA [Mycoplasmopsis maculosa]